MRTTMRCVLEVVICLVVMAMTATAEEKLEKSSDIIAQAQKLLASKKNAEAVKLLQGAIAEQEKRLQEMPKNDAAAFELAQLQFELQQDEAAAKSIELAISLRPGEAEYHAFQGKMLTYGEDKDAAEKAYQKAIELAPKKGIYYHEYSQLLYTLKKREAAEAQLRRAIEVDPAFGEAYLTLSIYLMDAGEKAQAVVILRQGIEKSPKHAGLRDALGQIYQVREKFPESYEQYSALAELEPENLRAQAKLVQLCLALGKEKDSNTHLENVFRLFREGRAEQEWFCREQFVSGKSLVQAMEYFELKGPQAMKYRFQVMDEKREKALYVISLGSYSLTTAVGRENGSIKKDERMYHLDYYQGREHRTYGMYNAKPPSYEEVRKMVVEIISGTRKPLIGSLRAEDEKTEEETPPPK